MAKKVVKKTKIKLFSLLIVLLVLTGLFFGVKCILNARTKNIIVKGTTYLKDDYILELAEVKNYPGFISLNTWKCEKNLNKSKYISKSKIKKKLNFTLELIINENKPLFYDTNTNKYVLSNNETAKEDNVNINFRIPRLLNYVPDKKYEKFKIGMNKIEKNTLSKISDIEYKPNDYDKDRFLLYMDDGNLVYLTLTKFKLINHYNEVVTQLEGHKGILYLDSGNHFQIME